jgi:hypothetical protein
MGMFSWLTNDTGESVTNRYAEEGALPVYLYDNEGNVWHEPDYDGYGEFGGMDYYELLAKMNGLKTRDEGIDLECDSLVYMPESLDEAKEVLFPNIAESDRWQWVNEPPERCPNQGFFSLHPREEDEDFEDYL